MDNTEKAFEKCATGDKRKELAERFTHYLKGQNTKNNAYVVNLNGAWKQRKSTFSVSNFPINISNVLH